MSRKPAMKMIIAPVRKLPTAKLAAAPKLTTSPRKVSKFGLMPVAASAPTMRSSSHFPPVPIAPVNVPMFMPRGNNTAAGGLSQMVRAHPRDFFHRTDQQAVERVLDEDEANP